jgi:hypothetical protein
LSLHLLHAQSVLLVMAALPQVQEALQVLLALLEQF